MKYRLYSSFSLCSAYVDPAPFIEACNHIAHEAKNNKEKQSAACNAAAVYVKVCRDNNILVNLPQHCGTYFRGTF